MRPRTLTLAVALVAGLFVTGLRADPTVPGRRLTGEQAVELALEQSRELQSLLTNVDIAEEQASSNNAINNPEIRIRDISTEYIRDGFDDLELGLRWRPPGLGEFGLRESRGQVRLAQRRVRADRYRDELAARVRRTCANIVMLEELCAIARTRVATEVRRLSLVEQMKDLGRRSIVYYTKARMWLGESRTGLSRLEQRLRQTRRRLARLTGVQEPFTVPTETLPGIGLSEEALWEIAAASRPEIDLVQQRKALAEAEYDRERFRLIPWFSFVEASYHIEGSRTDWAELVLGIELPLFNFNRGNIRATKMAVARKEDQSSALMERLQSRVRNRHAIYREALLDWELSSRDTNTLIAEVEGIIRQTHKHDTVPPDEVLELEITVLEARRMLATKRRDVAHALYELWLELGIDGPDALGGEAPSHVE